MNILVVAPHPDDEVLGAGGAIARHAAKGDTVHLVIVTKAYSPEWPPAWVKKRPKEVARAAATLGIKQVHFLDFPTVQLDTVPQRELNQAITRVINEVQPEIAYIPHRGDLNRDHRLVFEACLVALRPVNGLKTAILSYEVLSETEWGQSLAPFQPTWYVDISKSLSKKTKAMRAYSSEIKPWPHPRSLEAIEVLAKKRGSESGLTAAEAFELIREVVV